MEQQYLQHCLPLGRDDNSPEQPLRRQFLCQGAAVIALATTLVPRVSTAATAPRWMMVIDLNICTGCQSCVIACKAHNDTAEQHFNTKILIEESSQQGLPRSLFTPVQCNHCDTPPCVAACGEGATFKLASGIVVTDWAKCNGDQSCIDACPYGARHADQRHGNKADKCDFCLHLLDKGLSPVCVTSCPSAARLFGNALAPEGDLATALNRPDLIAPQPTQQFATAVRYIPRRRDTEQGGSHDNRR